MLSLKSIVLSVVMVLTFFSSVTFSTPDGFEFQFENMPVSVSGVFAFDPDGFLYFGHSSTGKIISEVPSKSSNAASNQIWKYNPQNGQTTLFYSSPAAGPGEYGINSACAIVIDTTADPYVYYIADQEPKKGSYSTTGAIWRCFETSGLEDGDLNDPSDTVELYTSENAIVFIEGLIFNTDTSELFVSNGSGSIGSPMVYRLLDESLNGHIEPGEISVYFTEPNEYAFTGKIAWNPAESNAIYTVDTTGTIYRLIDLNADHDCLDPQEISSAPFAVLPIQGGYDLKFDSEGDLFVTASNYMSGQHQLYCIPAGSTTPYEFDDLSAFCGWSGTICFGSGSSFTPGIAGASLYMNYSTLLYSDPLNLAVYTGHDFDVPAMSRYSVIILLLLIGGIIIKLHP